MWGSQPRPLTLRWGFTTSLLMDRRRNLVCLAHQAQCSVYKQPAFCMQLLHTAHGRPAHLHDVMTFWKPAFWKSPSTESGIMLIIVDTFNKTVTYTLDKLCVCVCLVCMCGKCNTCQYQCINEYRDISCSVKNKIWNSKWMPCWWQPRSRTNKASPTTTAAAPIVPFCWTHHCMSCGWTCDHEAMQCWSSPRPVIVG